MHKRIVCGVLLLLLLTGCGTPSQSEDWGSFTPEKTYSYDETLYAVQAVEETDGVDQITVTIHSAEDDAPVFSFVSARASDFWGVCWEQDTYNLWIQSGDIGVVCYRHEDGAWYADYEAERPEYIEAKE